MSSMTQPGTLIWREVLPVWKILPICDAVVCHGSESTVYNSLRYGCPFVICPGDNIHQYFYAEMVNDQHVGVGIDRFTMQEPTVVESVERIISDQRFAAACRALAPGLSSVDGAREGATSLTKWLGW